MKSKLFIHGFVVGLVLLIGDLGFNEGRGTDALLRDADVDSIVNYGKRTAYHANASIGNASN